ncbi:DegT/DnrJ/EryC1/StrS family aminotransferase [Psychroflexus sp. YR1-1]|uniref:DegT/DnrJ/EryC1/StrS family aminotransferase n=1 Tax=Psychroflexus aurantiacus TaxID=2709310 RepID=A0A6B3R151_9FLAO|nr:DegT/DnrJ/EryC1/StrS family aminotransferase [Psychroflexus aurantiacus]NEV93952.1 DegT/DnrJ/EryC1/StrS family aminotransferase [Psychroflexus aurantiacus]
MINVTKTYFPPIEDYQRQLERIWKNQWLTNNGELYKELSQKLQVYLGVNNIIPMTNGTLPLQIALNAFGEGGEVITTPFSYVATTATIVWEKCTPVFVDIHPEYLTIDETKIEAAITDKTTAILATHVYGNPCAVEEIEAIAKKHKLKVIYDAAHCFGVKYKGYSIFNYGDVSTCSFHATKLFHTGEGGALLCQDEATRQEMWFRHNFGHNGQEEYYGLGLNAKMSELQAAMGLSVLPYMEYILTERQRVCKYYDKHLDFNLLSKLKLREGTQWNYSYYPVVFKSESQLLKVKSKLEAQDIFPRRYFYPNLEDLPYIQSSQCPIADDIVKSVLCLPIYDSLSHENLKQITSIINYD